MSKDLISRDEVIYILEEFGAAFLIPQIKEIPRDKELQWYREQDLVTRKSMWAINAFKIFPKDKELSEEVSRLIGRMPKAEPPTRILFKPDESHRTYKPYVKTETHLPYSGMAGVCCMQRLSENGQDLRNGGCETCKNITLKVDDICIECLNGANHYEPYTPKENEQ